jgi:hypothetical protein
MFQNLNGLNDDNWKYDKLFNIVDPNIKNESDIGIIDSGKYLDISNNLVLYEQYADALFSKNSGALKLTPSDNSPLGNRYFIDSGNSCTYNNNQVNNNIVIDGMGFSTDISNVGLIYSAEGNLKMIQPEIIPSSISSFRDTNDKTCVPINLQKSNKPDDIEKNYISVNDYNRLNYTAFPNNCKKLADADPSSGCMNEAFETIEYDNKNNNTIVVGNNGYYRGYSDYIGNEGKEHDDYNFIPTHLLKYLSYKKDEKNYDDDDNNKEKEDLKKVNTNIFLHQDIVSTFFLGSITILGLYVIFRMIKRSRE